MVKAAFSGYVGTKEENDMLQGGRRDVDLYRKEEGKDLNGQGFTSLAFAGASRD